MIRPLNPKVKTILKVAIPLAVVAFVLFLWANARPVPVQVRVTFTGFSNSQIPLLTRAYFCVSNAGRCSVFEDGLDRIEIKNKPHDGMPSFFGSFGELKPGAFKTFSLFPPRAIKSAPHVRMDDRGSLLLQTNVDAWRVSLSFSNKVDWREKLVRNPPGVLRKVLRFVPAKWLERHLIEVHSDWINGPELMPVATNTTNTPLGFETPRVSPLPRRSSKP